jgi:hypothetical protein
MSLDGPARLAAQPNHEEASFDIDLVELEGHTLLIGHERQVALTAVKRHWKHAAGHLDSPK